MTKLNNKMYSGPTSQGRADHYWWKNRKRWRVYCCRSWKKSYIGLHQWILLRFGDSNMLEPVNHMRETFNIDGSRSNQFNLAVYSRHSDKGEILVRYCLFTLKDSLMLKKLTNILSQYTKLTKIKIKDIDQRQVKNGWNSNLFKMLSDPHIILKVLVSKYARNFLCMSIWAIVFLVLISICNEIYHCNYLFVNNKFNCVLSKFIWLTSSINFVFCVHLISD